LELLRHGGLGRQGGARLMEPLMWVKHYLPSSVLHQAFIDSQTGKALLVMTALVNDHEAELIGLMRQPDVAEDTRLLFWDHFKHELRQCRVRRAWGKVQTGRVEGLRQRYGVLDTGEREETEAGVLAIVEYPL